MAPKDLTKLSEQELDEAAYAADEAVQKARDGAKAIQAERDRRWAGSVLTPDVERARQILSGAGGINSAEAVGEPGAAG